MKIAMYADDITLVLQNEQDMFHALSITANFSLISGLRINEMRSEATRLGSKTKYNSNYYKKQTATNKKTCVETFFKLYLEEEIENPYSILS